MATLAPVQNWRELGLNPGDHYFNSGVLVIDLEAWRRESLASRFLKCLEQHDSHVWCWDQYALNVVLAGHWSALPLRWNLGSHVFEYPTAAHAPMSADEFESASLSPAAIHFTTEFKPWRFGSRHPLKNEFFEALASTAWAGWQPPPQSFSVHRTWQNCCVEVQKRATIARRQVNAALFPPRAILPSNVPKARLARGLPLASRLNGAGKPEAGEMQPIKKTQ